MTKNVNKNSIKGKAGHSLVSKYNKHKNKPTGDFQWAYSYAEREGFEPPVPLGTVVFKTTVIDHSTISPVLSLHLEKRVQR